jgi:hypothetical protein
MTSTTATPDDDEGDLAGLPQGLRLSDAEDIAAQRLDGATEGSLKEALAIATPPLDAASASPPVEIVGQPIPEDAATESTGPLADLAAVRTDESSSEADAVEDASAALKDAAHQLAASPARTIEGLGGEPSIDPPVAVESIPREDASTALAGMVAELLTPEQHAGGDAATQASAPPEAVAPDAGPMEVIGGIHPGPAPAPVDGPPASLADATQVPFAPEESNTPEALHAGVPAGEPEHLFSGDDLAEPGLAVAPNTSPSMPGAQQEGHAPAEVQPMAPEAVASPMDAAAARLFADTAAAAAALESLKQLLLQQHVDAGAGQAQQPPAPAMPPPLPLPREMRAAADTEADGEPAASPKLPALIPSRLPPERPPFDVRGFLAGFAMSGAIGVVLYLFLTAG